MRATEAEERHFFRRPLRGPAGFGESSGRSRRKAAATDYHVMPTAKELPMVVHLLREHRTDLAVVKSSLVLIGQILGYRTATRAFAPLGPCQDATLNKSGDAQPVISSRLEGEAGDACREAVELRILPLSLRLWRRHEADAEVAIEILLLWRQLGIKKASRVAVMENKSVFQTALDALKRHAGDPAIQHLALHLLCISTCAEMEAEARRFGSGESDSDLDSADASLSSAQTQASSENAATAVDQGICAACVGIVRSNADGFIVPPGEDLEDAVVSMMSRRAVQTGRPKLCAHQAEASRRSSAPTSSALELLTRKTSAVGLRAAAPDDFLALRGDAMSEAARKVVVTNCFRMLSNAATLNPRGKTEMVCLGCIDLCLRVMVGCKLDPFITKASLEALICACGQSQGQQEISEKIGVIPTVVRALQLLPSEAGVQLRGLELIEKLVKHPSLWEELDFIPGAWQSLCQGTPEGEALLRYQKGAFCQLRPRVAKERQTGFPDVGKVKKVRTEGAEVEALFCRGLEGQRWSSKRLQRFLGLSTRKREAAINVAANHSYFEAIRDRGLLPMLNETRHLWLERIARYERTNFVDIKRIAKEAAEELERRLQYERMQARDFDNWSKSSSGSSTTLLRCSGTFLRYP